MLITLADSLLKIPLFTLNMPLYLRLSCKLAEKSRYVIFYSMKFEWDNQKNQSNIIKHGFDFVDASRIFKLPMIVEYDERENYYEDRLIAIGLLDGRVVVIVYTEPDEETIRIISLRKALSHERKYYEQYIKNRLG